MIRDKEQTILNKLEEVYSEQKIDKDINILVDQNVMIKESASKGKAIPKISHSNPDYFEFISF